MLQTVSVAIFGNLEPTIAWASRWVLGGIGYFLHPHKDRSLFQVIRCLTQVIIWVFWLLITLWEESMTLLSAD